MSLKDTTKIKTSIVTIGSMKTVKTFFFTFPEETLRKLLYNDKKLKHSYSYPIILNIIPNRNPSIVTIGTVKTVKTFFLAFPALNSTAMNKKLKYSNSYLITTQTNIIRNPSIVTIGSMKTVKTFFLAFPALNSTTMNKKLKYSKFIHKSYKNAN